MADADDRAQQARMRAQPHQMGWFHRLRGLFKGNRHPLPADMDDDDDSLVAKALSKWWNEQFSLSDNRRERYKVFEEMDKFDLVTAVLDVYAEEATQQDYDKRRVVWVESKNTKMVQAGDECLRNVQAEDQTTPIVRSTAKMGDRFQRLIYQTGQGVLGWKFVPAPKMHRVDDKFGRLVGFKQDGQKFRQGARPVSYPWDYIHFRLPGKYEESGYGTSALESMYRPWRQMALTEDSLLMFRLRRAPDRNMVLVDVGDLDEVEAAAMTQAWKKRLRKHEFVDPASPNYDKSFNPFTPFEDIFMPVRDGQNSRVEQLSGSGQMGEVYDLDHFRRKFFGSAKVPQAYMGFEGDINAKATLQQQDVRFARTIKRLQKAAIYGYRQLLDIHYTLLPTNPEDTTFDFTRPDNQYLVQMSPISYLDEWERLELVQLRYQIVEAMGALAQTIQVDPKVWAIYVLINFAKLPEELVSKLVAKMGQQEESHFQWKQTEKGAIVLNEGEWAWGYGELSKTEKRAINEAVHRSAGLRKVIGDIAYYYEDDIAEAAMMQTDPSLLPPIIHGRLMEDDVTEEKEVKELREDMDALREEAKQTPSGEANEG